MCYPIQDQCHTLKKAKTSTSQCSTSTSAMLEKRETQVPLHISKDPLGVHGSMRVTLPMLLCLDSWGPGVLITQDNCVSPFLFTCNLFISYTEGLFSISSTILSCHSLLWISLGGIHLKRACQLCRYPPGEPMCTFLSPHPSHTVSGCASHHLPSLPELLETWVRSSFWCRWASCRSPRGLMPTKGLKTPAHCQRPSGGLVKAAA